jgi:hypothetical protein
MNTFVCRVCAKIITYNFGPCQAFSITYFLCVIKNNKNLCYNVAIAGKNGKLQITPQKIGY